MSKTNASAAAKATTPPHCSADPLWQALAVAAHRLSLRWFGRTPVSVTLNFQDSNIATLPLPPLTFFIQEKQE